jgi:hypothetical protein
MRDYTEQIREFWPTILRAWEAHASKRPVIECDLVSKKVRAYASHEYIDSLSERTRERTRREFARTMAEGGIMVFVLDTKNRVLQSYCFPGVRAAGKSNPNKPSHRREKLKISQTAVTRASKRIA